MAFTKYKIDSSHISDHQNQAIRKDTIQGGISVKDGMILVLQVKDNK